MSKSGYRWLGGLLAALLLPILMASCSGDSKPQSQPESQPPGQLASTPKLQQLFSDSSGELLAAAYREHVPTEREIKLVAAFASFLIVSEHTGELDPTQLGVDYWSALQRIAAEYPSFFAPSTNDGATQSPASHPLALSSDGDFSCARACSVSADFLQGLLKQSAVNTIKGISKAVGLSEAFAIFKGVGSLVETYSSSKDYADKAQDAIAAGSSLSASVRILQTIGATLDGAGGAVEAILAAAKILSIPIAVADFEVLATVGGILAVLSLVVDTAMGGYGVWQLYSACKKFHADKCSEDPACSALGLHCPREQCKKCSDVYTCVPEGSSCCGTDLPGKSCPENTTCTNCQGALCTPSDGSATCCGNGDLCLGGTECLSCGGETVCAEPGSSCCGNGPPCSAGQQCFECGATSSCVPAGATLSCCDGQPVDAPSCDAADAGADAAADSGTDACGGCGSSQWCFTCAGTSSCESLTQYFACCDDTYVYGCGGSPCPPDICSF